MTITIVPTNIVTSYNGARVRLWLSKTEGGTGVQLFVAGLAVADGQEVDLAEFAPVQGVEPPVELAEALQRGELLRQGVDLRQVR